MNSKRILCLSLLFVFAFGSFRQIESESLRVNWPEEYQWKIGAKQENQSLLLLELIPGNEEAHNWTIIGTILCVKGAENIPLEITMNGMLSESKKYAPDAKLTFIEKNLATEHPWILFKIESQNLAKDEKPESQLYYIIQGKYSLYMSFVAIKKNKLPARFVKKWSAVFKSNQLVYN